MADKAFRILLDVTDLYLENFKYVWFNVSPRELKTISDLKKYVLRKINLERDVQLFVRDGLLLDEETIIILREDDTVKIKYKTPVDQNLGKESPKKSASFSRKRNLSENIISDEDIRSKRHKPEMVTLSSNKSQDNFTEEKSKKKKRRKQTESPNSPEKSFSMSVIKSKTKKVPPIDSDNFCYSTEEVNEQSGFSENFENNHSELIEENQTRKKTHKKKKRKSSITCDQTISDINLCKSNDLFYSISTEFVPEKQKETKKFSKTILLETGKRPIVILNNNSSSKEEEEKLSFHQNESSSAIVNDINSEELDDKNLSLKTKTKRKRRRKRKKSAIIVEDNCDINVNDNSKSFSENIDENINRNHIFYSSPDKNKGVSCLNNARDTHNPSTSTFVLKEDKFPAIPLDYPKMSTPAQSNSCDVPDWQLSLMPSRNCNMSYNENDSVLHDESETKSVTSQSNRDNNSEELLYEELPDRENNSQKLLYESLPDVTSLPKVGTCIAYKALELDENYSPMVTNYREGVIESINPDTDEIEIRLNKDIILPGRSGKFENLHKDEVPEPIVKTHDVLKWCDIISPKFLSCLPE